MENATSPYNPVSINHSEAENFIKEIYSALLGRQPGDKELAGWTARAISSSPALIISAFQKSKEFKAKRGVKTFVPVGHYYSPIVNPEQLLTDYYNQERMQKASDISAVVLDVTKMIELWKTWKKI